MDPLFISFACERSRRHAVIAEEIGSIWLYLSHPAEQRPQRDCWLLNTEATPEDAAYYREQGAPPPAPVDRVAPAGRVPVPALERWSVRWSADGESVAALLDGEPVGFTGAAMERGFARHIMSGAAAWAQPWNDDAYRAVFAGSLQHGADDDNDRT